MRHDPKYHVVSCGRVLPGYKIREVKKRVAALCAVSPEEACNIVNRRRVLKKNLSEDEARKCQRTMERIGVEIRLLEMRSTQIGAQALPTSVWRKSPNRIRSQNRSSSSLRRPKRKGNLIKTLRNLPDLPLFNEPTKKRKVLAKTGKTAAVSRVCAPRNSQVSRSPAARQDLARRVINASQTKSGAAIFNKIARNCSRDELAAIGHLMLFITSLIQSVSGRSRGLFRFFT